MTLFSHQASNDMNVSLMHVISKFAPKIKAMMEVWDESLAGKERLVITFSE
jgi:hypothetical protein